jgi:hypothetical protein
VNRQWIVAIQHHIAAPVADSDNEQLDLEIVGLFPLSENLQYPLLGILVLNRRSLRAFGLGDHVLHRYPPLKMLTASSTQKANCLETIYS